MEQVTSNNSNVSTSVDATTTTDYSRSVLVTNISPSASNKTVADFFAFCGNISGLTMRSQSNSADNVQEAVIEFSQEAATKTALLLTNALIIDRPITVTRYTGETSSNPHYENTRSYTEAEIENKPHDLPASQRSQTSVIASILAAGYQLAAGTLESARTYDEKYSVSNQIYAGAATAKKTVSDLDQQYQVSATAASWYKVASDKWSEADQKYGISQSTAAAFKTADSAVKSVVEHPTVVAATQTVKDTGDALLNQPLVKDVVGQYNAVVGETQTLIAEKNPSTAAPSNSTTSTTSSTTSTTSSTVDLNGNGNNSNSTVSADSVLSGPLSSESDSSSATTPLLLTSNTTANTSSEVNPAAGIGSQAPLERKN